MSNGHSRIPHCTVDDYLSVVGASAWAVYCALKRYADANQECWPSVTSLEHLTGMSRRNVFYSLEVLESHGLILKIGKRGKNTFYRLVDNPSTSASNSANIAPVEKPKRCKPCTNTSANIAPSLVQPLHHDSANIAPITITKEQDPIELEPNNKYQPTPTASVGCATTDLVLATPGTATPTARETTRGTSRSNGNAVNIGDSGGGAANSTPVWEAYAQGYRAKYGVPPIRNAAVNKMLLTMIGRIGLESAIGVAGWFPSHRNSWYVTKGHSVQAMLGDCEKLRTEWLRGRMTTQQEAREEDRLAGMGQMWAEIAAERRLKNGS